MTRDSGSIPGSGSDTILNFNPAQAGDLLYITKVVAEVRGLSALRRKIQDDSVSGEAVLKLVQRQHDRLCGRLQDSTWIQ